MGVLIQSQAISNDCYGYDGSCIDYPEGMENEALILILNNTDYHMCSNCYWLQQMKHGHL